MAKTTTTPHRVTQTVGPAIITSITVTTPPAPHRATSLHDCTSIDQVRVFNMVWPINMATPARSDGTIAVKNGITVFGSTDTGSVTVVTA
jgi:hypothetical protein